MRDPLDGIVAVIERCEHRIASALPPAPSPIRDTVNRHAVPVFELWRTVRATTGQAIIDVAAAHGDARFAPAERERVAAEAATTASTMITTALTTMRAEADALDRALAPLGDMPRPASDPVTEARLAGIKGDIAMVAGAVPLEADAFARLLRFLADAHADGDTLTMWLIASPWSSLYVESRGFNVQRWASRLDDALAGLITGDAAIARRVLAELRGSDGLGVAIDAVAHWVRMSFRDLGVKVAA